MGVLHLIAGEQAANFVCQECETPSAARFTAQKHTAAHYWQNNRREKARGGNFLQ